MTNHTKIDIKANTRDLIGFAAVWQSWKILDVVFKNIWKTIFLIILLVTGVKVLSFVAEAYEKDAKEWEEFNRVYDYCVQSQMASHGNYDRQSCLKYANAYQRKYAM